MPDLPVKHNGTDQGRIPILRRDRKRAQKIIDAIAEGGTTKMAAEIGGIARRTLYEWLTKAEQIREARENDPLSQITPYDDDYIWFLRNYEKASFKRKKKHLDRIDTASEENWKASAWLLTHLHPDEFGNKQADVQPSGGNGVFTLRIGRDDGQIKDAEYEIVEP